MSLYCYKQSRYCAMPIVISPTWKLGKKGSDIYDPILVLGKRVLVYWEIRGNSWYLDYSQINGPIVPMGNYTFLESGGFALSKNI